MKFAGCLHCQYASPQYWGVNDVHWEAVEGFGVLDDAISAVFQLFRSISVAGGTRAGNPTIFGSEVSLSLAGVTLTSNICG